MAKRKYKKRQPAKKNSLDFGVIITLILSALLTVLIYAESGYVEAFEEGKDAIGGKEFIEKYNIEDWGIEATLYYVENDKSRITAVFVYEGVYYTLEGANVTLEEMKEVINNMK